MASGNGQELLNHPSTKELRQELSRVIESFVSTPGFIWQWHDQFVTEGGDQGGSKEEGDEAKGQGGMDNLLNSIMGLDEVQKLVAHISIGPQVKRVLEAAVKVIYI